MARVSVVQKSPEQMAEAAAVTATKIAATTQNEDFGPLAARIGELRKPSRGRPQAWTHELMQWSDRDLAAAILYHVIRTRLALQDDDLPPYASTIGTSLGTDLSAGDPLMIGCQLLGVAEEVGLIEFVEDVRHGIRVRLKDPTFKRLQRIVNGAAPHVRHGVRKQPPTGVEVKRKHSMLLPRPDAPTRVAEAADKVQGTAWHINQEVLRELTTTDAQLAVEFSGGSRLSNSMVIADALQLSDLERFYFPVFLDFRGRMYQRAGVLSYSGGGDYARGLLEFADGEFVDDVGLKWLAWHMAQMWGKDLPYMPLGDGSAWAGGAQDLRWQDAKHPVQFLAARQGWLDGTDGRPVHVPVRLDASCSGLQHLALLARDAELARTVNLWGDYHGARQGMNWLEIPTQDFYDLVAEERGCTRNEVKAVLVPLLYGAGKETSARQLAEVLGIRQSKRIRHLANAIRTTAEQLAPQAFALLGWFGEVAKAHNEAGYPVRWTTPSGFQAIQDYRVVDRDPRRPDRRAQIIVNGRRMNLVKQFWLTAIDAKQQAISLPSSIVHSLDAALLTEIVAGSSIDQWGVVHDAFAVSANQAWELTTASEHAVDTLYRTDRLEEWAAAWRADGIAVPDAPGPRTPLPDEMLGGLRTIG